MGRARAIPALAAAALLAGCATYVDETGGLRADWRSGNLKAAAQKAAELSSEAEGSGDELVFLLESGAVSRAAADFGQSRKSFDRAEKIMAARASATKSRRCSPTRAICPIRDTITTA